MTSKDLHTAILDSNFTVGKRYIGRCSQVYRGKKAIHVACSETYTKVSKMYNSSANKQRGQNRKDLFSASPNIDPIEVNVEISGQFNFLNEKRLQNNNLKFFSWKVNFTHVKYIFGSSVVTKQRK